MFEISFGFCTDVGLLLALIENKNMRKILYLSSLSLITLDYFISNDVVGETVVISVSWKLEM